MPRTCIICGKRAGSREHTFPAVLGGRRTDKGIYCGTHNQAFSPLAAIIGDQLKTINALLAVRPDHRDHAEPLSYVSPEGKQLVIFNGTITSADPDVPRDSKDDHCAGLSSGIEQTFRPHGMEESRFCVFRT